MKNSSRRLCASVSQSCPFNTAARLRPATRNFSSTRRRQLRTSELTDSHFAGLRAKPERLWADIHTTAQWGTGRRYGERPEQTGMSRLSLSDADRRAREWFVTTAEALSCTTHVDAMGNQFAVRPGLNNDRPATFAGSHLDTQPTGGRFDGVLGVCAGIEMLRLLDENWIETEGPVGVVNWTNEEGARFPMSMMGSGVWAGALRAETVHALREVGSPEGGARSVQEELERIGALGSVPANWETGVKLGGHFELHIEQGPHLVKAGESMGAVEGVQAYKWMTVTITGRDCHTGTTAFEHRADALYCAARLIVEVRAIAEKAGGLASVGIIKAEPGSVNTVPGTVTMSLDVRHHEDDKMLAIVAAIEEYAQAMEESSTKSKAPGIKIVINEDFHSKAVKFDPTAIECVRNAGKSVLGLEKREVRRMTSGAGHDSVFASMRCPTAMIFVPCKDGVSHHPEEWCEKEHCAVGASVLTEAILRFDQIRQKNGEFD